MWAFRALLSAFVGVLLAACAGPQDRSLDRGLGSAPASPPQAPASALDRALRHERVLIAAQPTRADLERLPGSDVVAVLNLRTEAEMRTQVDFDQASVLNALGLPYHRIEVGGPDHPWTPDVLERFAALLEATSGTVLVHCASGGRAAQLYAAYLVRYRGLTPDAALRQLGPAVGWPLPMERMLDRPLEVRFRGESSHP
jgi:uncharacterized protein (TIGR01244 family)